MKYSFDQNKYSGLLPLGLALVFILINLHVLRIGLLPIDDHEIIMASRDPIGSWLHSEAFQPWQRWRPSYYTIRYLESLLWQSNAVAWHLTRLIGISMGIYLLCMSSIKIVGPTTGMLLGIALVLSPILNDLAQTLGPAEIYCFLGLSLWAYGCTGLLESFGLLNIKYSPPTKKAHQRWHSFFMLIGSAIAAGSKENLVILIAPNLWMLHNCISLQKLLNIERGVKIMLGAASISMFPIVIFLGNLYANSGKDIYSKSLRPGAIEMLEYLVNSFSFGGLVVACASIFSLSKSIANRGLGAKDIILAFLLFMSIWSVYINRQIIPFYSEHRYALLHQLGIFGMFFLVVSHWSWDLAKWGGRVKKLSFHWQSLYLELILLCVIMLSQHQKLPQAAVGSASHPLLLIIIRKPGFRL